LALFGSGPAWPNRRDDVGNQGAANFAWRELPGPIPPAVIARSTTFIRRFFAMAMAGRA